MSSLTDEGFADADSCAVFDARLPLVTVGARVPEAWPRMTRPAVPGFRTKNHQTETSVDAPAFLAVTSTALGHVGPLGASDYLTDAQRRRRVAQARARYAPGAYATRRDDTVNSIDAPAWMAASLVSQAPPPALCDPVQSWRAGAKNRVFLSPLVEVDPFTGRAPRALLNPARGAPGFVPGAADAARIADFAARTRAPRDRCGVDPWSTTSAELGAGGAGVLAGAAPSPRSTGTPRDRFGRTASAAIGVARAGAALLDTVGPESADAAAPERARVDGARFRAEPPHAAYFAHRRDALALPTLAETVVHARWTGLGPAAHRSARGALDAAPELTGHALFRALTTHHGERAGQHLESARETIAHVQQSETGVVSPASFKSGPLHWYNATR